MEAISISSGNLVAALAETQKDSYSLSQTSLSSPLLTLIKLSISTLMELLNLAVIQLTFSTVLHLIRKEEAGASQINKAVIITM